MALTKITAPELFDLSVIDTSLQLPTGTTLERPTSPSTGEWRYNTDEKSVEYWDGSNWRQIETESNISTANKNFNVNTYFGNSSTHTIDAKFNEAATFDGSSSLITLPDSSVISQQNNFTLSFWVKPNGFVAYGTVLTLFSDYRNYVDIRTSGILTFNASGSSVDTPSSSITDGVWQHIAITKSSTAGTVIYVNGISVVTDASDTANASDFIGNGYPNTVGAYQLTGSASDFFPGSIDQVRIFNTALTSGEAADLYTDETTTTAATLDFPAGAGCVAAYQLDGNANDISTNYNGTTTYIGYTGLLFQPDFVWIKRRDGTENNYLQDSVRGSTQQIYSNLTDGQFNETTAVTSFDSNGFTMGSYNGINNSAEDYAAWCWNAGGSNATNNEGTQTSTVRANQDAGFSICTFTSGTGSSKTAGHGLLEAPKMSIFKRTDSSESWWVFTTAVDGSYDYLILNDTAVKADASEAPPTPTVITQPTTASGRQYVVYNFHDVDSYQKVGSYTGNRPSTVTVYTTDDDTSTGANGFKPSFLMIKDATTAAGENWIIVDNKREGASAPTKVLYPNTNAIEDPYSVITFTSNGFTVGDTGLANTNGATLIYLAIA